MVECLLHVLSTKAYIEYHPFSAGKTTWKWRMTRNLRYSCLGFVSTMFQACGMLFVLRFVWATCKSQGIQTSRRKQRTSRRKQRLVWWLQLILMEDRLPVLWCMQWCIPGPFVLGLPKGMPFLCAKSLLWHLVRHVSIQLLDLGSDVFARPDCHPQGLQSRILVLGDRKRLKARTDQVPQLQYTFEWQKTWQSSFYRLYYPLCIHIHGS